MKLTFRDIKKLGYEIHEDIHSVAQFFRVDLESDTDITKFGLEYFDSDLIESNYEVSETTYSIHKNNLIIDTGLSEDEVIEFFISGEYKEF